MHGLSSAEQIGLKTVKKAGATYMPMEDFIRNAAR
jgi:hypothetical protein